MKNLFRLICYDICKQLFSRPAFAPMVALAGGLGAATVIAFVQMDVLNARDASGRAAAVVSRIAETPRAVPDEQLNHQAQSVNYPRALARAFALDKGSEREDLLRDLLSSWAERNEAALVSWIAALKDPAVRRSICSTVCLAVAEKNPSKAIALALAPGLDEHDDGGLLEYLTMQWCEKEVATALEWVLEQAPGEWRDRLLARASFVLSKSDPAAAAQLVSGLEPGNLQKEAVMAVLHQWALKDSKAALQWAAAFPEPTLRERAFAEISNIRNLSAARDVES
ncbi:hypothetical protein FEM03_21540 [Phragmitibacter flavus]|uniref:Uncharacterized protein n=1 Tax=Phragmitibacter flavus TaxID=2576071 RepID=A0A5R8K8H9_9BACT|nr:hypothetical protein [Phragmitibacter flavus]TLD68628.1 hypothetical protein FEM03_21540 [Phragmitibacter flavus]